MWILKDCKILIVVHNTSFNFCLCIDLNIFGAWNGIIPIHFFSSSSFLNFEWTKFKCSCSFRYWSFFKIATKCFGLLNEQRFTRIYLLLQVLRPINNNIYQSSQKPSKSIHQNNHVWKTVPNSEYQCLFGRKKTLMEIKFSLASVRIIF